jgi:hypothetical protein
VIVALFVGVVGVAATAAGAAGSPSTKSLRAQVDAAGTLFFAAQARAAKLDAEVANLDHQLARARKKVNELHPVAVAEAVQLYQNGSQGLSALFDTGSVIESARRAELVSRAGDHTQGLLDDYARVASILERERRSVNRARRAQAVVVASVAKRQAVLEGALAVAQQAYRDQLAARAVSSGTSTSTRPNATVPPVKTLPVSTHPTSPAPVPVPPPAPPQSGVNPHHDDPFLVCTRDRESSGNYGAVNPGGYYGAYQFSQPTWDVTANHAGMPELIGVRPDAASAWDQDQLAWVLHGWQGSGPWGGLC